MSLFRCPECDEIKHEDIHGCREHPTNELECLCDDCHTNLLYYLEEQI